MKKTKHHPRGRWWSPGRTGILLFLLVAGCLLAAPPPSQAAQTCNQCHGPAFVHPAYFNAAGQFINCSPCHGEHFVPAVGKIDAVKSHDSFTAADSCKSCHGALGTMEEIATLHRGYNPANVTTNYSMSIQEAACALCHVTATSRAGKDVQAVVDQGFNGTLVDCTFCHFTGHDPVSAHDKLVADTSCKSCHAVADMNQIVTAHRNDCATCHSSTNTVVKGVITTGKGVNGTQVTCSGCHTTGGAVSHGTTADTASPAHDYFSAGSTNCASCHELVTSFAGIVATHRNDCAVCHSSSAAADVKSTITKGRSNQAVDCLGCHNGAATGAVSHGTTADTAGPAHDFFSAAGTDCASCHTAVTTFAGIVGAHTNCATCHDSTKAAAIAAIIKGRGDQMVNCLDCHILGGEVLNHGTTAGTAGPAHDFFSAGSTDCASCHDQVNTFAGIVATHRNDCAVCHGAAASQFASVTSTISTGRSDQAVDCLGCHVLGGEVLNHGTTGDTAGPVHDFLNVTAACATCHDQIGSFAGIVTVHTNCQVCHTSTLGDVTATIGSGRANSAVDCLGCHTGGTAGAPSHGTTASVAAAVHNMFNSFADCATCHTSDTAEARILLHATCETCHLSSKQSVMTTISTGKGLTGTAITCADCHDASPTGAITHGTTADTAGPAHNNLSAAADCTACHTVGSFADIVTTHQNDCMLCHGSSKGDVTATIFDGRSRGNNLAVDCLGCHNGTDGSANSHGTTADTAGGVHNNLSAVADCTACHMVDTFANIVKAHKDDCFLCHSSTKGDVVDTIDAGKADPGTAVNCTNCHNGTAGSANSHALDEAGIAPSHDLFGYDNYCVVCHGGTDTVDRIAFHNGCATCHTKDNTVVKGAIAAGAAGTAQALCSTCHVADGSGAIVHGTTPETAATVHDFFNSNPTCAACHAVPNKAAQLDIHGVCVLCHNSSKADVVSAISDGKKGTAVECATCHNGTGTGAVSHGTDAATAGTVHNNFSAGSTVCTSCHTVGTFVEIVTTHKNNCNLCHNNTTTTLPATATVDKGKGPNGVAVDCSDCHGGGHDVELAHDFLSVAKSCAGCHTYTTKADIVLAHDNDCTKCHSATGATYVNAIAAGRAGTMVDCVTCHTGHHIGVQLLAECTSCHTATPYVSWDKNGLVSIHNGICYYCHNSKKPAVLAVMGTNPINALPNVWDTNVTCKSCHVTTHDPLVVHNTVSASTSPAICADCHVVGAPFTTFQGFMDTHDVPTNGAGSCATCHNSSRPQVIDTITMGRNGLPVQCTNCHAADHTSAHDKTLLPSDGCSQCHVANVVDVHVVKAGLGCTVCHNSPIQGVLDQIEKGRSTGSNLPVLCTDCHGPFVPYMDHSSAHNHTVVPQVGVCDQCHSSNVVVEHVDRRGLECITCHNSSNPTVIETINLGKGDNGIDVSCDRCHNPRPDHFNHTLIKVTETSCTSCHNTGSQSVVTGEHKFNCSLCHDNPALRPIVRDGKAGNAVTCDRCHGSIVTSHPTAHDSVQTDTECAGCHTGAVPQVHAKLTSGCGTCHGVTTDTASGITAATINATIAAGKQGTIVRCSNCHGTTISTHGSQHDMAGFPLNPTMPCADCHNPNVVTEHVDKRGLACTVCHVNPAVAGVIDAGIRGTYQTCENCHGVTDHKAAHNMTAVPSSLCASCHANNVVDVHLPNGTGLKLKDGSTMTCGKCHANPAYTSIIDSGKGPNGTTVTCDMCHGLPNHTAQHDMTDTTTADCKTCHNPNVVIEHVDVRKRDCAICHNNPAYDSIIASGRAGNKVLCSACHANVDHTAAHDKAGVPAEGCKTCHNPNMVTEHVTNRKLTCGTCHSSTNTTVKNAISAGMNGTFVTCLTCHGSPQHHANDNARTGKCTICHTVPTAAKDTPVQAACRQCHTDSQGRLLKKDLATVLSSHNYNTQAAIQDFGACIACHNYDTLGTGAPKIRPYHAKPGSKPPYRISNKTQAPGRGSFNLFYNQWHRTPGEDNEGREPGCGEDSGCTDRNWRTPSISYSMVTVNNNGANYSVPAFSGTSGSGSSTPSGPYISSMSPTSGRSGTTVTISGSNFGSSSSNVRIYFDGSTRSISNFSSTSMRFTVPSVSSGTYSVYVTVNGTKSNTTTFQVTRW